MTETLPRLLMWLAITSPLGDDQPVEMAVLFTNHQGVKIRAAGYYAKTLHTQQALDKEARSTPAGIELEFNNQLFLAETHDLAYQRLDWELAVRLGKALTRIDEDLVLLAAANEPSELQQFIKRKLPKVNMMLHEAVIDAEFMEREVHRHRGTRPAALQQQGIRTELWLAMESYGRHQQQLSAGLAARGGFRGMFSNGNF